jgi:hypothetical protein
VPEGPVREPAVPLLSQDYLQPSIWGLWSEVATDNGVIKVGIQGLQPGPHGLLGETGLSKSNCLPNVSLCSPRRWRVLEDPGPSLQP